MMRIETTLLYLPERGVIGLMAADGYAILEKEWNTIRQW